MKNKIADAMIIAVLALLIAYVFSLVVEEVINMPDVAYSYETGLCVEVHSNKGWTCSDVPARHNSYWTP